jgi:hypothetical protein
VGSLEGQKGKGARVLGFHLSNKPILDVALICIFVVLEDDATASCECLL